MILCVETATNLCSVALCEPDRIVSLRESGEVKSHASLLTVFIGELLKDAGIKASDLEAVSVSKGPGSYTGLRIGVSAAKGISYGAGIPLIGIETTFSMFWGITETKFYSESDEKTIFCPMLDARRMEVYYSLFDRNGNVIEPINARVIEEDSFNMVSDEHKIVFFGEGSLKLKNVIKRNNVEFVDDFNMSSTHLRVPSFKAIKEGHFEDVAYFEPLYLKDFITTIQKKNLLGT
jgi:tRNA threonylcarbamoyladenosine biosynthesis protein TsaB